jgi:uncharacterized protein YeaO (DUF488 family)
MAFQLKRAYEQPSKDDGDRILVDRLWPRGISKPEARITAWRKELAPSSELRRWYGHKPERFEEFRRRYREELQSRQTELEELRRLGEKHTVTLVFGARDVEHSDAAVLLELLKRKPR